MMIYMMTRCHEDMDIQWLLRSTTGSYERTCNRGRIWEDYDSLHRSCLGDVNLRKMVGVSSWCITHVRHARVNTSVGTVITVSRSTWKTTKMKWSRHRSFLYGCDRSLGIHVFKLGTEIPNLKQHNWSTTKVWDSKLGSTITREEGLTPSRHPFENGTN